MELEGRVKDIVALKLREHEINYDSIDVVVFYDLKTVGVQGDERTYNYPIEIGVRKEDKIIWDEDFLEEVSTEITNKIEEINRVTYSIL